jgi:hypothetical protein
MLSEITFARISSLLIEGSSTSSSRKSFLPYNLIALVTAPPDLPEGEEEPPLIPPKEGDCETLSFVFIIFFY